MFHTGLILHFSYIPIVGMYRSMATVRSADSIATVDNPILDYFRFAHNQGLSQSDRLKLRPNADGDCSGDRKSVV